MVSDTAAQIAEVVSASRLLCISPPVEAPGEYLVEVSVNGVDFSEARAGFTYEEPASVAAVTLNSKTRNTERSTLNLKPENLVHKPSNPNQVIPSQISAMGGGLLTVVGSNFRDSAMLQASFGGRAVRLAWVLNPRPSTLNPKF